MAKKTIQSNLTYYFVLGLIVLGIGTYLYMNYMQKKSKASFNQLPAVQCYAAKCEKAKKCPALPAMNKVSDFGAFRKTLTVECNTCVIKCLMHPNGV